MKSNVLLFICLSIISSTVFGHGPTPQKADQSIVIDAPIDKVWDVIKNFDQISNWHPGVKTSTGDGKNESGGERSMALANGDLLESLDYYSDSDHEYNYRLKTENTDVFPVSSYSSVIQLISEGNKTKVKWKSRFYRGDTSNSPPTELNDESANKAMKEFIQGGLTGLKETLEK